MRKIWDIHGGVHPPENKTQSNGTPIAKIPLPEELIIPLNQHIGAPCAPVVKVGDTVLKGETIAAPQGFISTAAHAPSSGEIIAIEERAIPHASGLTALCVVLKPDGHENWKSRSPLNNWRETSTEELVDAIRDAGIAGMGGAGFPTSVKMTPRGDQHIDTLILNGTECEPYITADDMLMREYADEIVAGAEIIAHILKNPANILIGVEDNKPEAAEAMRKAAQDSSLDIDVVTFPTKYPSGGEKQLIQILTGKEVASGKLPADVGIVLQNVGTAQAVYRAICKDEPLISRITTVVGESLETQQNIEVLIGTPVEHILDHHGFDAAKCQRLIIGGPMMGFAMENTSIPVIKTTNCVLVPSLSELPVPQLAQACIRCGMCAESCPASLLPQQLYWYSRSEDFDRLRTHNLADCIECGACSYVCPSNIPLVQYYRASKGAIRQHDEEKRKAEHSRQRFEFRKERLEKAEAEKEAKRAARKKAAEAAKAKQAQAPTASTTSELTASDKSRQNAPIDDMKVLAKLQRALSSAESRLERAKKALNSAEVEGNDSQRLETLSARIKEAEKRVSDAQQRLETHQENEPPESSNSLQSNTDEAKKESAVKEKLSLSAIEKLQKSVETIEKRLATARQKVNEAEEASSPTVDALKTGVAKLEGKLNQAKQELEEAQNSEDNEVEQPNLNAKEANAADAAIEKAKQRAEALASMSEEDKTKAQLESLKKRLEKARIRLEKAEADGDDNIDAFRAGVQKLETKFNELTQ